MTLAGLDHLQLAIPVGGEDAARGFYGDLLGLREVPKPAELAGRAGAWFVGPGIALHLGTDDPFVPALRAHPAFLVDGLPSLLVARAAAGVPGSPDESVPGVRRAYIADPFGNRIELIESADGGFTEPPS